MAIINCPECNKEVSDKAQSCPNCGFGVAEFIERQEKIEQIQIESEYEAYQYVKHKKQEEKERIEREKKAEEQRKDNVYKQAINKFESNSSKDVEEAEKLFFSISGWKDANTYYEKCRGRIEELKNEEELKAIEAKCRNKRNTIIVIGGTVVIAIVILICIFVIIPNQYYLKGMDALKNNQYELASEYLKKSNVQDDELLTYSIELILDGELNKANEVLKIVGNDAFLLPEVQETYYKKLCSMIELNDGNQLIPYLLCIEDLTLREKLYALCDEIYENAESFYIKGEYEKAYQFYTYLEQFDYSDSEVKAKETHTHFGSGVFEEKISMIVYKSYDTVGAYELTRKETETVVAKIEIPYENGERDYSSVTITFTGSSWGGNKNGWQTDHYKYVGEFSNGTMNGKGILYFSLVGIERIIYEGDFLNAAYNGYGILYLAGEKYIEGEWKNNNIEGSYVQYYHGEVASTGTVHDGIQNDSVHGVRDYND